MKILAVGFNYREHCDEALTVTGQAEHAEAEPIVFLKGDSTHRLGKPFFLPDWSNQIDYEAEIVVQIDRVGKYISERFAHRYYNKVSIGLDLTARDLQRRAIAEGKPWTMSKCFDSAAVVGEWIDKSELSYPDKAIELRLDCDGVTVQQALSSDMIHSIDRIIAYVSQQHTLKMGDIIFTGTPSGVGTCRVGQRYTGYLSGHKLLELEIK